MFATLKNAIDGLVDMFGLLPYSEDGADPVRQTAQRPMAYPMVIHLRHETIDIR